MRSSKEIIEVLKKYSDSLKESFGVKEFGVFGSYVRELYCTNSYRFSASRCNNKFSLRID